MSDTKWGEIEPSAKQDQLKLMYDYIKFHITLYLATPAALAVIADGFKVKQETTFGVGLALMIVIYFVAGANAGLFMSKHINDPRQPGYLESFEKDAFAPRRRFMHHSLYWIGLIVGLVFLAISIGLKCTR